ncbi:hypothetical protein [Mesorhizobium shangrilense]|uniref:Uncharacterized protein n=1 Tax=Mesorhizobium shangrilense TaxID=460060 RepID=A0ABV2DMJ9_9HYPH
MRDLPRDIDADVVIEIGKLLDDTDVGPLPVHDLVKQVRTLTQSIVSDQAIEQLIVEMAANRGLSMIFEMPPA